MRSYLDLLPCIMSLTLVIVQFLKLFIFVKSFVSYNINPSVGTLYIKITSQLYRCSKTFSSINLSVIFDFIGRYVDTHFRAKNAAHIFFLIIFFCIDNL